jgi:hypothetical protein
MLIVDTAASGGISLSAETEMRLCFPSMWPSPPPSNYEGGGTHVEGSWYTPIEMEQGSVMCHAGGAPHAGRGQQAEKDGY